MRSNRNKEQSESQRSVEAFPAENPLQKPEETILSILKPRLSSMRMLDLGVGGGRTARFFAPLVGEYMGIDYAQAMIHACKKALVGRYPNAIFQVGDATSMPEFSDNAFDFVLFSYNGIDYVNLKEREQVLQEVHRVGKSGGYFCFSSHNIYGLWKLLKFHPHRNPKRLWNNLRRFVLMRLHNPAYQTLIQRDMAVIKEAYHSINITNVYIKPIAQIEQLKEYGFSDIRLFGLDGHELQANEYDTNIDSWVYYLCRIP